jgi:ketosteroid isomerase-like protein
MSEKDKEELSTMFEVSMPAVIRARDVPGYASFFSEDAIWCPPGVKEGHGPAEIAEGFAGLIAGIDIDPIFTTEQIGVKKNFAYLFGRGKLSFRPIGGGPTSVNHSRELRSFRKENGVWKITHMMWNSGPSK